MMEPLKGANRTPMTAPMAAPMSILFTVRIFIILYCIITIFFVTTPMLNELSWIKLSISDQNLKVVKYSK